MDSEKTQPESLTTPDSQPEGVIISPDTRRANRVPPGQSRTRKWPIVDAGGPPRIDLEKWELKLWGLVSKPVHWSWPEFQELSRVRVFSDFHCVTRWSRLGNVWEGVSVGELVRLAGGIKPEATHVLAHGHDHGWTTNMPLDEFLAEDALVAITHDGEPLSLEHGAPARLIVPRLYAWKSAKWLGGLEFLPADQPGFWEQAGYSNSARIWDEERYWTGLR